MRFITTLCLLLFSSVCFSQIEDLIRKSEYQNTTVKIIPYICGFGRSSVSSLVDLPSLQKGMVRPKDSALLKSPQIIVPPAFIETINNNDAIKKPETKIVLRCGNRYLNETPLFIVDGVLQDSAHLKTLDPNDIESFYILKDAVALAIYGCRAARGVIIISTKSAKLRTFIIKDFLDGNRIPGATVSFISADKKDTIMLAANDSGVVMTDKLKASVYYEMSVSAIGYKILSQPYKNEFTKKSKVLMMEREMKVCQEVVLTGFGITRRCGLSCRLIGMRIYPEVKLDDSIRISTAKTFPNPVQKGRAITIETTTQSDEPIEIRLISLDGKLLLSQPQKAFKGLNRFTINTDFRWAAGIYFVQLYANGKLLASEKVVIQ